MIDYTLRQDEDGQWSICRQGSILASRLPLDSAIEQAHELAHTERMDSGRPTCVDLTSAGAHTRGRQSEAAPRCRSANA